LASSCLLGSAEAAKAADFRAEAKVCLSCHGEYSGILASNMRTRANEARFIQKTFSPVDLNFAVKNCNGCHIASCLDCHAEGKPDVNACLKCHNGENTGADYAGMGIREDHERYQRGPSFNGINYMKMLPDAHYEKGFACGGCHTMRSLAGNGSVKQCAQCHSYSRKIVDHSIKAHDNLACAGCHAAWSPTEYGAFYIRLRESKSRDYFRAVRQLNSEYVKSSFMRLNIPPALGKNEEGKYIPIRPRLVFFTDVYRDAPVGDENRMLSNLWEPFAPHTLRRETLTCEACHNDRRKYLIENDAERIFLTEKDGLQINSFHDNTFFRIDKGSFVTEEDYTKISMRTTDYIKAYLKKLEQMKNTVKNSR
jgi:hypothetical protein